MIVMKFGGTSVEDASSIQRVSEIIRERLASRPVVVVSAMGKTTRKLLQAAEASAAGDARTTLGIVAGLKNRQPEEGPGPPINNPKGAGGSLRGRRCPDHAWYSGGSKNPPSE